MRELAAKPAPTLPARYGKLETVRALLVPEVAAGTRRPSANGMIVVTGRELL